MPLLRFDIIEGRSEAEITAMLDAAHEAVREALNAPLRDRFQVVHQHPAHELVVQDNALGYVRSRNVVLISITSIARTDDVKQRLYKALVDKMHERCGIAPGDVMISLVTNTLSDWSFGDGEAQFLTGALPRR